MILSYLASVAASGRRLSRRWRTLPSPGAGWRQLRRNRLAMFCLILLAVMAVWCVLGPVWSPWSDDATDALSTTSRPGGTLAGTDFSVAMSTPACCWPGASR